LSKVDGEAHFDEACRTCALPTILKARKTDVLWLNSSRFGNLKDTEGHSAVPYLLVVETKPKE
jgi:hypothetical protein